MKQFAIKHRIIIAIAVCLLVAAVAAAVTAAAVRREKIRRAELLTGGNAEMGFIAMEKYGCAACHVVPGLQRQGAAPGPPLEGIGSRAFVAGVIQNQPENLVRWIMNPPAIDPKTAMPNVGVTEADARNIAAFLYAQD